MFHQLVPSTRSWLLAGLAVFTLVAAPTSAVLADSHISSTGAAIVGGIAGLAIGAAIVDSTHHNQTYYPPPRYQPYGYPQPYPAYAQPYPVYAQPYPAYYPPRPAYARPFSPAPGVVCYPGRGLCYNDANGSVANRWSARVFGN